MAFLVSNWLTYLQVDVIEAQYSMMARAYTRPHFGST